MAKEKSKRKSNNIDNSEEQQWRSVPQEKANKAFEAIKKDLGYYGPKATLRVRTIPKRNIK